MNLPKKSALLFSLLGVAAGAAGAAAWQSHAQVAGTATSTGGPASIGTRQFAPPAAAGNVTAISGNTITITDKRTGASYAIDASSATIEKFSAPSTPGAKPTPQNISVSDIKVGDNLIVQGVLTGSSIKAANILDGKLTLGGRWRGKSMMAGRGTSGKVTAINGSTAAIMANNGETYTVNLGSATISKLTQINSGEIQVGDTLHVQGNASGSTITAQHVLDGVLPRPGNPTSNFTGPNQ